MKWVLPRLKELSEQGRSLAKSSQNWWSHTKSHNDKHNLLFLKWNRGHRKVHFFGVLSKILLPLLHKNSPITAGIFFFSITQFIVSQYISICSVFTWSHRKLNSESNSASSCKLSFTLLSGYVNDIKRVTVCTNSQEQF